MSFQSPLPNPPAGPSSSDARSRRVRCDLPARFDVLPGEVDLVEMWLGELIAELSSGGGAAVTDLDINHAKEMK